MKNLFFLILISFLAVNCGSDEGSAKQNSSQNKSIVKVVDGQKVYEANCIVCHGEKGDLAVSGAKDIRVSELDLEERINLITNGAGLMMPYKSILDEVSIEAVAKYSMELKK